MRNNTILDQHGTLTDLRYDAPEYYNLWHKASLKSKLLFAVNPGLIPQEGPEPCDACGYNLTDNPNGLCATCESREALVEVLSECTTTGALVKYCACGNHE